MAKEEKKKFLFRVEGRVIAKNADEGIKRLYFLLRIDDIEDLQIKVHPDPFED